MLNEACNPNPDSPSQPTHFTFLFVFLPHTLELSFSDSSLFSANSTKRQWVCFLPTMNRGNGKKKKKQECGACLSSFSLITDTEKKKTGKTHFMQCVKFIENEIDGVVQIQYCILSLGFFPLHFFSHLSHFPTLQHLFVVWVFLFFASSTLFSRL